MVQGRFSLLLHIEFSVKTHTLARSAFGLHGHRLYRDIVVVMIVSVGILKFGILSKLESGGQQNWKYGLYRISPSSTPLSCPSTTTRLNQVCVALLPGLCSVGAVFSVES